MHPRRARSDRARRRRPRASTRGSHCETASRTASAISPSVLALIGSNSRSQMRQPNCGRITRSPGAVMITMRMLASMSSAPRAERDRARLVDAQREQDAPPDEVCCVRHVPSRSCRSLLDLHQRALDLGDAATPRSLAGRAALQLERRRALGLEDVLALDAIVRPSIVTPCVASILMLAPLIWMSPWSVMQDRGLARLQLDRLVHGDDLDLVRAEVLRRAVGEGDLEVLVGSAGRRCGSASVVPVDRLAGPSGRPCSGRGTSPPPSAAWPWRPTRPPSTNGRRRSPCSKPTSTSSSICGMNISPAVRPGAGRDDPRPPALLLVAEGGELDPHPADAVGVLVVGDDADRQPELAERAATRSAAPAEQVDDRRRVPGRRS